MNKLEQLVDEARGETAVRRAQVAISELDRLAALAPPTRPFGTALRGARLQVIAEMKAASPSAGTLSSDYSPAALARRYTEGGAAALSVLAQSTSFGGDPEHIREARTATDLPVMRKDFITDEYQVLEARAFGADAVLLIAAALTDGQMRDLEAQIRALGMEALVEVHNRPELERVLDLGTGLIGINHRDLTTLEMDLELTERLRPLIPADRIVVAESGIRTPADAWRLRELGVDAVLVGEALMRSGDPAGLIRELGR